jgi:membrane protein required for colicin V production
MEYFENTYFNIIDIIIIFIISISLVVATFRGFIKEAFSILSWVFALIVSFQLYERFKLELLDYINQKIIIDVVAFGFPFLTTLFVANLISRWLSPKFSIPGLLIFDKLLGLIFGVFRGILFVVLLYLGLIYLLGKEKSLPSIVLNAHSFDYIKKTAGVLVDFVSNKETYEEKEPIDISSEVFSKNQDLKER